MKKIILISIILAQAIIFSAQPPANPYKAPLYWNPYEYNIEFDDCE